MNGVEDRYALVSNMRFLANVYHCWWGSLCLLFKFMKSMAMSVCVVGDVTCGHKNVRIRASYCTVVPESLASEIRQATR